VIPLSTSAGAAMPTREAQVVREQAALAIERAALARALLSLPFLTSAEVARIVRPYSESSVRKDMAAGRLRAIRLGSKSWRTTPEWVCEWLGVSKPDARR
jgi:hypothetical protein